MQVCRRAGAAHAEADVVGGVATGLAQDQLAVHCIGRDPSTGGLAGGGGVDPVDHRTQGQGAGQGRQVLAIELKGVGRDGATRAHKGVAHQLSSNGQRCLGFACFAVELLNLAHIGLGTQKDVHAQISGRWRFVQGLGAVGGAGFHAIGSVDQQGLLVFVERAAQ